MKESKIGGRVGDMMIACSNLHCTPPIFDSFICNATDGPGFLPDVSCILRFEVDESISVPAIPAVFAAMGDNLDGIFYINVVIMASVFVGATILSLDTMWTKKRRTSAAK